jgi:F420-0:gamma-glutamyl ligase-like protein
VVSAKTVVASALKVVTVVMGLVLVMSSTMVTVAVGRIADVSTVAATSLDVVIDTSVPVCVVVESGSVVVMSCLMVMVAGDRAVDVSVVAATPVVVVMDTVVVSSFATQKHSE